jgi:hypothetical protein
MAPKPKKSSRPRDIYDVSSEYYQGKKEKKGNRTAFINDGTGYLSTSYTRKGNKEIMTNYEKRNAKGDYMKFEVPKGSAKTAQAERGKTLGRAKKVETSIKRAASVKKLAEKTSKAERKRTESRKSTPRKPKRLY